MNRNDQQSGWDTDQFPNSVPEVALAYYEVLRAGGFGTGGTNFDAKLRRQSLDPADLVLAHAGAMDVCARGLKAAAAMLEDGSLERLRAERYAGWETAAAKAMLAGDLGAVADRALAADLRPRAAVGAAGAARGDREPVRVRGGRGGAAPARPGGAPPGIFVAR